MLLCHLVGSVVARPTGYIDAIIESANPLSQQASPSFVDTVVIGDRFFFKLYNHGATRFLHSPGVRTNLLLPTKHQASAGTRATLAYPS